MKKVFITGGNGLLGSNLARYLNDKFEVWVMVRSGADLKGLNGVKCKVIVGDISNKDDVYYAVRDCKYVIHSAAITKQVDVLMEQYEKINLTGTKYIAEACIFYKVDKLIYVSTAGAFAAGTKAEPGTELNGYSNFRALSGYINSKYLAQQYILEQVVQNHLPAVVVNPTFMIGPYDTGPSSGKVILLGLKNRVFFYPPLGKSFVSVVDVCQGIFNALENGTIGESYILAGENLSFKEFYKMLFRIANHKCIMIKVPAFLLKIIGECNEVLRRITGKTFNINKSSAFHLCTPNYYSGEKSKRELNIIYHPFEETVKEAYHWFLRNNYIKK